MNRIPSALRHFLTLVFIGALAAISAVGDEPQSTNAVTRKSPDWLRNAVVYEIFPRNFSPAGDLNGITVRLDELKDLGADVLWLMPIHPIGEKLRKGSLGSPYSVRDFYAINPSYGPAGDFKQLIAEAHRRGMKVIMDIVVGHTAWDSVMMEHPEFYQKGANGQIRSPNPDWTDVAELNYGNPSLRSYMTDIMKHWVREFGVDGFRCDTAFTVPVDFWESARAELEKTNPQVIIITDSGAKPALLSKAFDVDYSGNLFSSLGQVLGGMSPASLLRESWTHRKSSFPRVRGTCVLPTTTTKPARWSVTGRMVRSPPRC